MGKFLNNNSLSEVRLAAPTTTHGGCGWGNFFNVTFFCFYFSLVLQKIQILRIIFFSFRDFIVLLLVLALVEFSLLCRRLKIVYSFKIMNSFFHSSTTDQVLFFSFSLFISIKFVFIFMSSK